VVAKVDVLEVGVGNGGQPPGQVIPELGRVGFRIVIRRKAVGRVNPFLMTAIGITSGAQPAQPIKAVGNDNTFGGDDVRRAIINVVCSLKERAGGGGRQREQPLVVVLVIDAESGGVGKIGDLAQKIAIEIALTG